MRQSRLQEKGSNHTVWALKQSQQGFFECLRFGSWKAFLEELQVAHCWLVMAHIGGSKCAMGWARVARSPHESP